MPEASLPVTLKLVSDRWVGQRTPPHHRKSVEMAVIVRATSKEQAAMELESLAQHLRGAGRDGMLGNVGGGCGFHATSAYAAVEISTARSRG